MAVSKERAAATSLMFMSALSCHRRRWRSLAAKPLPKPQGRSSRGFGYKWCTDTDHAPSSSQQQAKKGGQVTRSCWYGIRSEWTRSTSTGYLTLGRGGIKPRRLSYTPLLTSSQGASFYFLELRYISVGGRRLPISPTVFSTAGTLIESGTVISRLPPKAYSALSSAFKQQMSKYPSAPALSILDTCYDLTNYPTISVPMVAFFFRGGAVTDLSLSGILYASKVSQVCLAFAPNTQDTDTAILWNVQQLSFEVVYDVDAGRIGFGPNAC